MATNSSLLENQAFSHRTTQQDHADALIHALDRSALHPGNLAVNYFGCLPGVQQRDSLIDHLPPGTQPWFVKIIEKLWLADIPNRDHVEHYLRDQYRRNLRRNSIRNTLPIIISFMELAKRNGKHHLEDITRSDLGAFIEEQQDRGLKPSSVRNRLHILKAFLRYEMEKGTVSPDIFFKKMCIKVPDCLPKAMEMEDEARLLSVVDDIRDRAMVLLLLRTGMRIGELLNMKVRDIHLEQRKINIWETQKNRIGRVVYFSDDARDALSAWYQQRDPEKEVVFYARGHDTMSYGTARSMFCKYLKKAELDCKGYTLHCLRHTNASSLLNAGIPLECLRELLGHNSVEVTRRYARLTNKTREKEYFKAMEKIERGEIDGYYKLDRELQEIFEEKKLLPVHGEKLHEHP